MTGRTKFSLIGSVVLLVSSVAHTSEYAVTPEMLETDPVYSPFVGRNFPDQVLFGDTHFHTELSFDAGLIGTRLDAEDAFRFARGEAVISNTGQPVQLIRPLDFLIITDHAEFIGLAPQFADIEGFVEGGEHVFAKVFQATCLAADQRM